MPFCKGEAVSLGASLFIERKEFIISMVGGGTSRKLETVGGLFTTTLQDISTKIKQMQRRSVKNTPLSDHATKK
jgi:hypothetical protein